MQEVRNRLATSRIYTACRSAGPAWISVLQSGEEQYRRYWKTGVTFDAAAQISAATFVNPAFTHDSSGKDFNVHYGTDPILAFHLGMVALHPQFTKRNPSVSELVHVAKEQFKDWCLAFKKRIEDGPPNIVIRLWAGDALAFSRALLAFANTNSTNTGVYPSAWEATPIILDGLDYSKATEDKAPLKFDVIDTSNLVDHLGLINILTATVPLLVDHPAATLYTNSLLNFDGGKFVSRACTEITTLSLLLGIVPASYVSGFSPQSNMHEVCTSISGTTKPCQETIPWKRSPADSMQGLLQIAARPLGSILFNIYLKMFRDDEISCFFNVETQPTGLRDFIHYDRSSFAIFLALVKQKVHSDWMQVMDYMLSSIERDETLLMGLNKYQDLRCQLHIYGVVTISGIYVPEPRTNTSRVFDAWDGIPPVVCVVLKVPRIYLKGLEGLSADKIGTPIFQCEVESLLDHNVFSATHFFFGTTTPSSGDPYLLIANEDTTRWCGNSPLIVSFYVPSLVLDMLLPPTMVRLSVHPRSIRSPAIYSVLGPRLCIFSVDLLDKTHVQVVRGRPGNPREFLKLQGPGEPPGLQEQIVTMLTDKDSMNVNGLTGRININDTSLQATFRACSLSDITVKQTSPFSMLISIGQAHQEILQFPYPIDGSISKTRIARKSSYIEVSVFKLYS
ncbi:hypothetical protein C0993_012189 [Termitomyces sp. T159_Od127]|nr:hypothetical protein C0993_012189 [Termitomyces sp. T159_Od127]